MPHLLIVGAGPGIAAATARRFGAAGHQISLIARRAEPLEALARQLADEGRSVGRASAEAGDPDALTGAIEQLIGGAGPVDVLLYNASVGRQIGPAELTPHQLAADLAVGVVGLQTAVRAVLPGMRALGGGTVLVTGSGAADRPFAAMPTLGAQKAAVRALAQALAAGLAPDGVHVATATLRGLVGEGAQIEPDRVAELYAELAAETAGPAGSWRTVVDVRPG